MIYTLRIKKKYYDLIKSGEKKKEYRSCKSFYEKISDKKYKKLKLHYQGKCFLICKIDRVRKIKKPKFLSEEVDWTPKVWEISISKPKEYC